VRVAWSSVWAAGYSLKRSNFLPLAGQVGSFLTHILVITWADSVMFSFELLCQVTKEMYGICMSGLEFRT